jgi:uncharacterized protein
MCHDKRFLLAPVLPVFFFFLVCASLFGQAPFAITKLAQTASVVIRNNHSTRVWVGFSHFKGTDVESDCVDETFTLDPGQERTFSGIAFTPCVYFAECIPSRVSWGGALSWHYDGFPDGFQNVYAAVFPIDPKAGERSPTRQITFEFSPPSVLFQIVGNGTPDQARAAIKAGAAVNEVYSDHTSGYRLMMRVFGLPKDTILAGRTPLMCAARDNNDPGMISVLVEAGAKTEETADFGETALMFAAMFNGNPKVVDALLKAGAKLDATDSLGRTALAYAASANPNPDVVRTLLSAGADARERSVLQYCAFSNPNPEVLRVLIGAGARLNDSILVDAIHAGAKAEMVTALLKAGARLDDDAVYRAVSSNAGAAVVEELTKAGANTEWRDSDGVTALLLAAEKSADPSLISVLVKVGARIDACDNKGSSAVVLAVKNKKTGVIAALVKAGAKVDGHFIDKVEFPRGSSDVTTLLYVLRWTPDPQVVDLLLHAGAHVQESDSGGLNAITYSALFGKDPALITVLVQAGAQVNQKDKYGITPLIYAISSKQKAEMIAAFIKSGARVDDVDSQGNAGLTYAAAYNPNPEVIRVLVQAGAKVNDRVQGGITPLMMAARFSTSALVIQALLDAGADTQARDNSGNTAYKYLGTNQNAGSMIYADLLKVDQELQ